MDGDSFRDPDCNHCQTCNAARPSSRSPCCAPSAWLIAGLCEARRGATSARTVLCGVASARSDRSSADVDGRLRAARTGHRRRASRLRTWTISRRLPGRSDRNRSPCRRPCACLTGRRRGRIILVLQRRDRLDRDRFHDGAAVPFPSRQGATASEPTRARVARILRAAFSAPTIQTARPAWCRR